MPHSVKMRSAKAPVGRARAVTARTRAQPRQLALLGGTPCFREPLYITRPRVPDAAAFGALVASIFRARWFTNDGALVRRLEDALRRRLGVDFCAAFCNGTIGLLAALRALEISGEVITTPFTFPATVHAIEWTGLTPVFCDIDPDTYNLDVVRAAGLISSRTSALLPVHVFGNPCDVMGIAQLAARHRLRVVYDAAHAFGVSSHGRPIGCWGDLSIFSFHATKLFHTGEGGAVVGADRTWLGRIASLRNFGIISEDEVCGVGLNGKLSELSAALGITLLEQIDEEIRTRGRLVARYRKHLVGVEGVRFQRPADQTTPNNAYFVVEIDAPLFGLSRDAVHAALRAENIISRKYFFPLCSENEAYRHLASAQPEQLPHAHRLASRVLCLPLYGDLSEDDVDRIVECLLAIKAGAAAIRSATRVSRP